MDKRSLAVLIPPFLIFLLIAGVDTWYKQQPAPSQFYSGDVVTVGNPLAARWPIREFVYARNIWDLQRFEDKIYIGSGNSANKGPAPNAGPIDIWSYTPETDRFIREGVVNDEQIDQFKIINGELVIPGHDAATPDNWDFGNYYKKETSTTHWSKYRRIPNGIHVYDMEEYQSKLFAALGTLDWYSGIGISKDNGETWKTHQVGFYRFYTLFKFQNKLYASGIFYNPKQIKQIQKRFPQHKQRIPIGLYQYHNEEMIPLDINIYDLFPGWQGKAARIRLPTPYKNSLVYIGALPNNDHQYSTQHLYTMASIGKSTKLVLPKQFSPMDILLRNDQLLVLVTKKTKGSWNYQNAVFKTKNLKEWTFVEGFHADTFARSFEVMDGCFYYGMGTGAKPGKNNQWDKWAFSPLTGVILKSQNCIY